jgi:2-C-methyl-D-erythritol 2,4-cyclodiphosphate synthase
MRVGIGYDVHRFTIGRKLILGGVEVPHKLGLEAYSDGDVIVHAIMDAILGAAGLGDIGQHFPPGDPQYRDASSLALLERVSNMVWEHGYRVVNVDVTALAEAPKIGPHVSQMKTNISRAAGIGESQVNVKATTNEGLGSIGRSEGIAAYAVALLE